ncbi:MAG TPA: SRPBCC domain-containing protein, partial [Arthrobacter sp.]
WYRTSHQVGLTVHDYAEHGEGLLVVSDHPAIKNVREEGDGSLIIASTYDLGAGKLEAVRSSWDTWRSENYPDSNPVS